MQTPSKSQALRLLLTKIGELWKNQDEKMDIENKKEPDANKKKNMKV